MFTDYHLHPLLSRALEEQGYATPTEVQAASLDEGLAGKDLMICSQTGSGKTLAYLIPMINRLLSEPRTPHCGSRALILLPTRELAMQVFKLCSKLINFTRLDSVLVTGGQETDFQAAKLRKDPDIIVATPGRLQFHLKTRAAELTDVMFAVLDEADRMLDMGFRDEVMEIMAVAPKPRQTMLLSATLKHRGLGQIADELLEAPVPISLATVRDEHTAIQQALILADDPEHKIKLVRTLIAQGGYTSVLIFANKRTTVEELMPELRSLGRVNKLHGEMRQDARKKVISSFREKRFEILIATDVAARGLDIDHLALVINYDMPHSGDEYIHRIGRTGRAGNSGEAISLVAPNDWNLSESIQRYLRQRFELRKIKGLEAKFKGPNKQSAKKKKQAKKVKAKSKAKPAAKRPAKRANTGNGMAPPKRPTRS